jgi:hypothetical protein
MSELAVFHLLYVSRATQEISQSLMGQILDSALRRNPMDRITGFLTARDSYFLQLIEGPEDKVRALFEKIKKDFRHSHVRILGESYSEQRIFPDWSMGCVPIEKVASSSEDLLEVFVLASENGKFDSPESLQTILRLFSKNVRLIGLS